VAIRKGDDSDSYLNLLSLLVEANEEIPVDISQAYKYANYIASKGHTYATHIFAMLNQYHLGSMIKSCQINVEFFKSVSERSMSSKRKFDYAYRFYKEGFVQIAALLYIELAEEGHEVINITFKLKYNINKLNYLILVCPSKCWITFEKL